MTSRGFMHLRNSDVGEARKEDFFLKKEAKTFICAVACLCV